MKLPFEDISALIFDLDGTLADTMPAHYEAWCEIGRMTGLQFPEDRFYSLGGWPTRRIVELLCREQGLSLDQDQLALQKEQAFLSRLSLVAPIPEVMSYMMHFSGILPMAVATGSRRHQALSVMRQIGIDKWFNVVVCAEDCPTHKPEPEVFLLAARQLGVTPGRCLVFEDTDPGIEAAQRAGMKWMDVRALRSPGRTSQIPGCQ